MGIRLDWQIESERVYQKQGEDPDSRRRRRQQRFQILLIILLILILIGVGGGLIWLRLFSVDNQLQQSLIDTAHTEASALEKGDYATYVSLQRSSSREWTQFQLKQFHSYQDLITHANLVVNGNVIDATVDGARGRILIEELQNGVPYRTVWFYWHYPDGWRHVPSDTTFWGSSQEIQGKVSTVKYNDLDAPLARVLSSRVDEWWTAGCQYLGCTNQPKLTVQIVADRSIKADWIAGSNTLVVPSPLATDDRAPANSIPQILEDEIARKLAEQLFGIASGQLKPAPTADAAWLRSTIIDWLTMTLTKRGSTDQVSFVQSLRDHYGPDAISMVVHQLSADADISVVGAALKKPLESLALEWRSFFQWRLDVEKILLASGSLDKFKTLWDVDNQAARTQMDARIGHPSQAAPQVQSATVNAGTSAAVQATLDGKPETIIFRLIKGSWKRSA